MPSRDIQRRSSQPPCFRQTCYDFAQEYEDAALHNGRMSCSKTGEEDDRIIGKMSFMLVPLEAGPILAAARSEACHRTSAEPHTAGDASNA